MSHESMRAEQNHAGQMSSNETACAESPRWKAIATTCAVLVLPLAYLVTYYGMPRAVAAHTAARPPQSAASQQQATIANRINLALDYIHADQPARAIPLLDSVVKDDASNAVAWNNLCVAYTMQKSYNQAIADCQQALRIQPRFQLAKNNLAWATSELEKTQKTVAQQEQTAPPARDANFYLAEGMNFLHLGNYDQAIEAWQRMQTLDPHSALAANNMGTAYMFKKQPEQAKILFLKAIQLDPSLQIARNNLAWATGEIEKQRR